MHERGGQHGYRELHDLRGLEADQANVKPTLRSLADVTDRVDDQQQQHADAVEPWRKTAQEVRTALRQSNHRNGPDAYAHERAQYGLQALTRSAVLHHYCVDRQQSQTDQQRAIEFQRR